MTASSQQVPCKLLEHGLITLLVQVLTRIPSFDVKITVNP